MFMAIMEKNNELQTTLLEVLPKIGDTTNSHNTNNFNINVFLNEQCKDAINIMDFVNSLPFLLITPLYRRLGIFLPLFNQPSGELSDLTLVVILLCCSIHYYPNFCFLQGL